MGRTKKLPSNIFWHPGAKSLVRVNPGLVSKAKVSEYTVWGTDPYVDCQEFIVLAGAEIYLIAGLLGLGLGYLISSATRQPTPGDQVKVVPNYGRPYTGPWEGIDPYSGQVKVGGRDYDPDRLKMAGPVKRLDDNRPFVDLNSGWVNPDELAKLVRAHNRDGYRRRKERRP